MTKKKYNTKKSNPVIPIIVIASILLGLFLTIKMLQNNSDVRGRASNHNNPGIGSAISEEKSESLKLSQPSQNEVVSNPVVIKTSTPTQENIERVQFFVDNDKTPFSEVFEAPFETSTELTPGRHRVHIVSYDQDGNVRRSNEVTFQVR